MTNRRRETKKKKQSTAPTKRPNNVFTSMMENILIYTNMNFVTLTAPVQQITEKPAIHMSMRLKTFCYTKLQYHIVHSFWIVYEVVFFPVGCPCSPIFGLSRNKSFMVRRRGNGKTLPPQPPDGSSMEKFI